jgi:hypothetical protein
MWPHFVFILIMIMNQSREVTVESDLISLSEHTVFTCIAFMSLKCSASSQNSLKFRDLMPFLHMYEHTEPKYPNFPSTILISSVPRGTFSKIRLYAVLHN